MKEPTLEDKVRPLAEKYLLRESRPGQDFLRDSRLLGIGYEVVRHFRRLQKGT